MVCMTRCCCTQCTAQAVLWQKLNPGPEVTLQYLSSKAHSGFDPAVALYVRGRDACCQHTITMYTHQPASP